MIDFDYNSTIVSTYQKMIPHTFSAELTTLRQNAKLTNRELGELARVPHSLIAGLQSGRRAVGECQARRIAVALNLRNDALEAFVLRAINTCTEKVLTAAKDYPAEFINFLPMKLRASGITPNRIHYFSVSPELITVHLTDGCVAQLAAMVA